MTDFVVESPEGIELMSLCLDGKASPQQRQQLAKMAVVDENLMSAVLMTEALGVEETEDRDADYGLIQDIADGFELTRTSCSGRVIIDRTATIN